MRNGTKFSTDLGFSVFKTQKASINSHLLTGKLRCKLSYGSASTTLCLKGPAIFLFALVSTAAAQILWAGLDWSPGRSCWGVWPVLQLAGVVYKWLGRNELFVKPDHGLITMCSCLLNQTLRLARQTLSRRAQKFIWKWSDFARIFHPALI